MFKIIVTLTIALALPATVLAQHRLFDATCPNGIDFPDLFRGVAPVELLSLGREDCNELEAIPTRYTHGSTVRVPIDGDYMFTEAEFRVIDDKITYAEMYTDSSLPPSRGRVERSLQSVVDCLGAPSNVYAFNKKWEAKESEIDKRWIVFQWQHAKGVFRIELDARDHFKINLSFTSALYSESSWNPKAFAKIGSRDAMSTLKGYLDFIKPLPAGDAGYPKLEPASDLEGCLEQYSQVADQKSYNSARWRRQYRELEKQLATKFDLLLPDLDVAAKAERLLQISRGQDRDCSSSAARFGAAAYLAEIATIDEIDVLFNALAIKSPEGIHFLVAPGIARFCEGEIMDRVMAMLDEGDYASMLGASVLGELPTETQRDEARQKASSITSDIGKTRWSGVRSFLDAASREAGKTP